MSLSRLKSHCFDATIIITSNNVEIGKVLIANKFSFALIKFKDKEFEYNKEFKCGEANIEILKPNWLN